MKGIVYSVTTLAALLLNVTVCGLDVGRKASYPSDYGSEPGGKTKLDLIHNEAVDMFHLVRRGADNNIEKIIYSSQFYIYDAHWSHDYRYFAFQVRGEIDKNATEIGHKLVIMDKVDKQVTEIPDVRAYRWSPFGSQMAVITGGFDEGGMGFVSKATFLYDVENAEKVEIPVIAYDLYWAEHDNTIYMNTFRSDSRVEAFDPVRRVNRSTSYLGIYFSPDGSFYYSPTWDGSLFTLRKTENNELVATHPIVAREYLHPRGWLESTNCLVVWDNERRAADIINVETGKSFEVSIPPDGQLGTPLRREFWGGTDFTITDAMLDSLK